MATGLLQQGMQPQGPQGQPPQQPPQGQAAQQPPGQGGDPRVDMDPKQGKQQVNQLANAMLEMLYGPMLEKVKQIFGQHQDKPEKAIARILAQMLIATWKTMNEQGKAVPPGVLVQAGMVAVQAVGEMAVRMGILPKEGNAEPIEAGFMLGMGEFGKATAQEMPPEQRKRYGEMLTAIRDGRQQAAGGQQRPQGGPQGNPQGGPPPRRDPRAGGA